MNTVFLLSIVATTIEMTACLICARHLLRFYSLSKDLSRRLLITGSLVSGLLAAFALAGSIGLSGKGAQTLFLQPGLGLVYMSMHIIMTLYPVSVARPDWLIPKHYFFLFLPVLVFTITFICFTGHWTPLYTKADIWANARKADVIVRLASLFVMFPYCIILFLLPYNYKRSSASFKWVLNYCFGLSLICVCHIVLMLTYNPTLIILLPLLAAGFYILSTEYELEDRLRPGQEETPAPAAEEEEAPAREMPAMEPGLWSKVCRIMDQEEAWRDPDLTLIAMTHRCGTNMTYLNKVIREETGGGFKEMVNARRIASVVEQLKEDPDTDIQVAFFNAGFRSRITAWRNFKEIMGVTPTEFRKGV